MAEFGKPRDVARYVRNGKRERITVSSTAKALTASTYQIKASAAANQYGASDIMPIGAEIQVQTEPINFVKDGTTATALLGFVAAANDIIYLNSLQEIQRFSAIRNGASDATLEVLYFYGR